jgi:mannose-6-phosphate isomerase-like protein (cupin superfamily)
MMDEVTQKPWGSYTVLFRAEQVVVKQLTIEPDASISLQFHNSRSERWYILKGKPSVELENGKGHLVMEVMAPGEIVDIPAYSRHRIRNFSSEPAEILEIQSGKVIDEEDIVRLADIYGRIT